MSDDVENTGTQSTGEPIQHGGSVTYEHPAEEAAPSASEWFWRDGEPGAGERPAYLHEGKTVEDMAKRADDLRRQISTMKEAQAPVVPENYAVNLDKEVRDYFNVGDDDPLLNSFMENAKNNKLSQETFDNLVSGFFDAQSKVILDQIDANEKRYEELGIDKDQSYERISNWAKHNLDGDKQEAFINMAVSADNMNVLLDVIGKSINNNNIAGNLSNGMTTDQSRKDLMRRYVRGENVSLKELHSAYNVPGS